MKIEASFVRQESQHLYRQESVKKESLFAWVGDERPDPEGQRARRADGLTISAASRKLAGQGKGLALAKMKDAEGCQKCESAESGDPKLEAMRLVVEAITGRKIVIRKVRLDVGVEVNVAEADAAQQNKGAEREGWGLEYDYFRVILKRKA
ncbi:MAG: hypothetical protein ABFS09_00360 [Thermodesulfobacteriota bacterium]